MGSSAFSFYFQYLTVSLKSSGSCLHLLPRLPINSIFPWVTCFRRQFLRRMWPIQLAFLLFTICTMLLPSLTLNNISYFTRSVQLFFSIILQHHIAKLSPSTAPHFKTMKAFLICLPKLYSLIVIHLKFEVYTHRHVPFNTSKPEKSFYLTKNTSPTLQSSIG